MKKITIFGAAVITLLAASVLEGSQKSTAKGKEQASRKPAIGVRVANQNCIPGECVCIGKLGPEAKLNETGPHPERLAEGISCLAADFNGDGFTDFALPGGEGWATILVSKNDTVPQVIKLYVGGVMQLYQPREAPGSHGEPAARFPGILVEYVGRNHAVFIWSGNEFERMLFPAQQ